MHAGAGVCVCVCGVVVGSLMAAHGGFWRRASWVCVCARAQAMRARSRRREILCVYRFSPMPNDDPPVLGMCTKWMTGRVG